MIPVSRKLIERLPKTELHVHIEGTLEPELMFELGSQNGYALPFSTVEEVKSAYRFTDLQSFLDIYYQGAGVLQTPEDFYRLMYLYLERAVADGVRHAEIFFDPQTHTERGIGYDVFMEGFRGAIADATSHLGISADLILCFLRHLTGEDAVATLHEAEGQLEGVIAVGLDSSEVGRPSTPLRRCFRHGPDTRSESGCARRRRGSTRVRIVGPRCPGCRTDRPWNPIPRRRRPGRAARHVPDSPDRVPLVECSPWRGRRSCFAPHHEDARCRTAGIHQLRRSGLLWRLHR